MAFTRTKFLTLSPASRASKLAQMLKTILESNSLAEGSVGEYKACLRWLDNSSLPPPGSLCDQYYFWDRLSGYSRGKLKIPGTTDRSAPSHSPIAWCAALDSMRSGYNTGSIIRTADAFGFSKVILGGYSPGNGHRAVRSSAMGSEQWVPQKRAKDLLRFLKRRQHTVPIIGLELSPGSAPLSLFEFGPSGILVLGNEERGISSGVLKLCDHTVAIPMYGRKHSLNVASAFAIAAHAIRASAVSPA